MELLTRAAAAAAAAALTAADKDAQGAAQAHANHLDAVLKVGERTIGIYTSCCWNHTEAEESACS